jgi:hypothetical protein
VLTCTGVSFFHGSNDGQKGMGLIMLILIGTVPTTYALNHAVTARQSQDFVAVSRQAADAVGKYVEASAVVGDPRDDVTDYIRTKEFKPNTMLAMRVLINDIGTEMAQFKELSAVPRTQVRNFRNDMYLVSEALRLIQKPGKPVFATADVAVLKNYKSHVDKATRFIPLWVKVAVALALGLGTTVGWKRIVVTVGEKIGKNHLTYAARRSRRNHGHGHDRRRRRAGTARQHDARAFIRRRRHHAREFVRLADEHGAQPVAGLGTDVACGHDAVGPVILRAAEPVPGRLASAGIAGAFMAPCPSGSKVRTKVSRS